MKLIMKLSCIATSLCLNLYCAEQKPHIKKNLRKNNSQQEHS